MSCLALLALSCLVFAQVEQFDTAAPQHGEGTYYTGGTGGHCSLWPLPAFVNSNIQRVALNNPQYNQSRGCGMCLRMWGTGSGSGANPYPAKQNAILAWVDDECPECKVGDIDANKVGDGRWGIEWVAVDCPIEGGLQFMFQGSHNFYMKLQVRNHKIPVKSLEFKSGSTWYMGVRQPDNFFLAPAGFPFPVNPTSSSPLEVKITGIDGLFVIDAISQIPTSNQVVLNGLKNVQLGSLSSGQPVTPKPVSAPVAVPKPVSPPPTAPVTVPKPVSAPVAVPKPVSPPPTAPVSSPSSSGIPCSGVGYSYSAEWWIEINAPAGKNVKVQCPDGLSHGCTYNYGKYQCAIATQPCLIPRSAIVDGASCPLDGQASKPPEPPVTPPVVPKPVSPPVQPPTAPVTPPSCTGVSALTQSDWWIEVKAPSLSSTVSVLCNSGQTVSCLVQWGKHVCDTKGVQCTGPRKAKVDNNVCPLGAAARIEDENPSSGFPAGAIAGIVVAAVVLVALVVGVVVYFRRRPQPEERF